MGFLDGLGNTIKTLGNAALAGPGVIYDTAMLAMPGDQWGDGDDSFGDWVNSLGSRANDLTFFVPEPVKAGLGDVLDGLYWAYKEGVDEPLSTALIVAHDIGPGRENAGRLGIDPSKLFSPDEWSKAYDIAQNQSLGQSFLSGAVTADEDLTDYAGRTQTGVNADGEQVTVPLTPFADKLGDSTWANIGALGIDFGVGWMLDPTVVLGRAAGIARQELILGRIPEAARPDFAARLDGSIQGLDKTFGIPRNWSGRFDEYFKYISGDNKLGRPLNAAEIRAISPELQRSSGGLAISSALEDALRFSDSADRLNAVRRVFAVAIGDQGQVARLTQEVHAGKALAVKLNNITRRETADLTEQALDQAIATSPTFRAKLNAQVEAMDQIGEVRDFVKAWELKVHNDLTGQRKLLEANRTLTHLPGVHRGPTGSERRLAAAHGEGALDMVERGHRRVVETVEDAADKVVDTLLRSPRRDSYSAIWQQGLGSLPLTAIYPARFIASLLPSNTVPKIVRGLKTVHFNGVVDLHDWTSASDQLSSMLIHAGVDNDTRLQQLSRIYKAHTEADRLAVIQSTEHVAMAGLARTLSEKHGMAIDPSFIRAAIAKGQSDRGRMLAAMNGNRLYATTLQPDEIAARSRGLARARRGGELDAKAAAEKSGDRLENWVPRVDQIIDSNGTPATLPVISSQLANRIPLLDVPLIKQMTNDKALAERLARHSDAWAHTAVEESGIVAQLARATGTAHDRLARQLVNIRKAQDMLLGTASFFNRWWKVSVLFRLGYPMRVVADDHMRIAARIGYLPFLGANLPEAARNAFYNHVPAPFAPDTRLGRAKAAYEATQARYRQMVSHFGRESAPTDAEWAELSKLHTTYLAKKTSASDRAAAKARMDQIDPDGRVIEFHDLRTQAQGLRRAISGRKGAITRWEAEGADPVRIARARRLIAEDEAALAHVTGQLAGRPDPAELRAELGRLFEQLRGGPKGFREPKRKLGESDVPLGDGSSAAGAFAPGAYGYREAASSGQSFNYVLTDGEEMGYRLNAAGHWRSVAPGEPGYYQLWANILNHQFQHSPEIMTIVRGAAKTPREFAAWVRKPEQSALVERMRLYAHDPEDWGGRLLAIVDDYAPSTELRELVAEGRVSARQLKHLFPEGDQRLPNLHGQLADIQSGRAGVMRGFSDGIQRAFRYLSEVPTDSLSRHPFFNAIYKREVQAAHRAHVAAKGGSVFGPDDLAQIEALARKNALGELQRTLWDVSAHSHAAHVMRFLSPFFAAHQEALNRWWNIVKDDPSVARHFQLFFDSFRQAELTTDDDGNMVLPGDPIGPGNHIAIRLPFADEDNAVNKWLRKIGGGKYWSINENGLNLILQNGIANPGVGPLVTIPVETIAQKYPEAIEFERAARVLNQYPPTGDGAWDIAVGAVAPAWAKRWWAAYRGEKSAEFSRYYMQNFADVLTTFRLDNDREPTEAELGRLQDEANKLTHSDLVVMGISNLASITPARPGSRFSIVQDGLARLYEQMRAGGHDMDWLREMFRKKYGDIYMPLIYSLTANPAGLDGSAADVAAIKAHRGLLGKIDTSLVRMAIGPEISQAGPEERAYSPAAAGWLSSQETGTAGVTYRGKKNPEEAARELVVAQGWDMYEQLTNALDVQAAERGLSSYEESAELRNAKALGMDYIKDQNPVFAHDYDEFTRKSYDGLVDDMRQIADWPKLRNDPMRSDVALLGDYIKIRDTVAAELESRAAAGGSGSIRDAQNADLARGLYAVVQYLNSKNTYFKDYMYPIIERDPFLLSELAPAS